MGDVLTGQFARPAVREFFLKFASYLDTHFGKTSHPVDETDWLDHYLGMESNLHRSGGTDLNGITEKDVRLMMAIYLWEVYYLIREESLDKPVMAAYNFVMSEAFQRWNRLNPVELKGGIFQIVEQSLGEAVLPEDEPRVQKFNAAAHSIAMSAGPPAPAPLGKYKGAPAFNDSDSDSEPEYFETEDRSSFVDNTIEPEVAPDGVGSSKGPEFANDVIEMVLTIVREKNRELHSSFFFVFHLYILLKVYPTPKAGALSSALGEFMARKNTPLPFNASLPIQNLVNEVIVDGISANIQSVGQDDRTPEGLVLRELVEYCINIKQLLDDKRQQKQRTQTYRDFNIEELLSDKFFLVTARAEIKTNMLTTASEEDMLEAIRQSNAPDYKKLVLKAAIVAASGAAVAAMASGAIDAIAEGTANAARVSTVPGTAFTSTNDFYSDDFYSQQPDSMGVEVNPAGVPRSELPWLFIRQRVNAGSNLDIPSRRRPRPTFFDHALTV